MANCLRLLQLASGLTAWKAFRSMLRSAQRRLGRGTINAENIFLCT
jgi:hypothetical protein